MNNSNVLPVNGGCVFSLKSGRRTENLISCEVAILGEVCTAVNGGFGATRYLVRVLHICSAVCNFSGNGVKGSTCLTAENFGSFIKNRVNGGHLKKIG